MKFQGLAGDGVTAVHILVLALSWPLTFAPERQLHSFLLSAVIINIEQIESKPHSIHQLLN